jgi:hypothetical protein
MIVAYLVQARSIDQLDKRRVLLFQLLPIRQALYKVPFCQIRIVISATPTLIIL